MEQQPLPEASILRWRFPWKAAKHVVYAAALCTALAGVCGVYRGCFEVRVEIVNDTLDLIRDAELTCVDELAFSGSLLPMQRRTVTFRRRGEGSCTLTFQRASGERVTMNACYITSGMGTECGFLASNPPPVVAPPNGGSISERRSRRARPTPGRERSR